MITLILCIYVWLSWINGSTGGLKVSWGWQTGQNPENHHHLCPSQNPHVRSVSLQFHVEPHHLQPHCGWTQSYFIYLSISTTFKINNPPAKTGNSFLDREGGNLIERKKIKKLSAFVFASLAVPWNNQNIPAQPRLRFYQTFPYLISHGFQFLQEKWKSIVL